VGRAQFRIRLWAYLLLAFAAAAIPGGAAAAAPSATIETCFAPESDCAALAVRAIDRAERQILVGAYGLTTGSGIVEALLRAHRRGVEVKLIADRSTPCGRNSGIDPLAGLGCRCGSTISPGLRMPRQWSSTAP
jgi:phosphatidylserine/phosphatidylglycerophosphate/cardiolipin synthase-like enzyme